MKRQAHTTWIFGVASLAAALAIGCGGDDDDGGDGDGDGDATTFTVEIENVSPAFPILKTGEIDAPIMPGNSFSATFTAPPGARFSFATMFVPSNDYFFAPDDQGIALWTDEAAPTRVTGDVTAQVMVWDAGTEINQTLGTGPDQVQNQGALGAGAADPDTNVRLAVDVGIPPDITDMIGVSITAGTTDTEFVVTITNASTVTYTLPGGGQMPLVFSPGIWAVHGGASPLFTVGSPDLGAGLEAIAEDGERAMLAAAATAQRGINIPISPGVYAVHSSGAGLLFDDGAADLGLGLEAIAEDGMPGGLATALAADTNVSDSGAFDTPVGASAPGGLAPGATPAAAYSFEVSARPGDRLSLAAMFVASNDLFFAFDEDGIALFNGSTAVSGDVTGDISLWDAGTEVNQEPGVGLDQVQRQAGADTGAAEGGVVQKVSDAFTYPAADSVIRVTITPMP